MKKIIPKHVFLIFLFFFPTTLSLAQNLEENQEVRSFLDDMFQPLDKTRVPYGLLRDYAFELVNLDRFDGTRLENNNYVDRQTYELLLRTLRSSAVNSKPFSDVETILTKQYSLGNSNTISISGMLFRYSAIRSDALSSGLIKYENEKVYDNFRNGEWQNPYENKYALGFCAQDSIFRGSSFTFKLDKDCWLSNLPIQKIEIDPGIGSYRQISVGESMQVTLSSFGVKTMRLKVTLSNGTQLSSHSKIKVLSPSNNTKYSTGNRVITITGDSYKGVQTSALVTVKTRDGRIKNPLIFVEGFDPVTPLTKINDGYGIGNFNKLMEKLDNSESFSKLLLKNFDIVYVDWKDSENYIQANANTLTKIIEWLNQEKKLANSKNGNVIIGQSMGGLIVRYSLKTMENNNKSHETTHFVSYDTPHLGANVPIGILYALHGTMSFLENKKIIGHYIDKKTDSGTYLELAERIAHSNAARQMLVNYVDFGGNLNNSLHNSWQDELATLGFPQGDKNRDFKNIAIANGSYVSESVPTSYMNANFSASSDIIDLVLPFVSGSIIGVVLDDFWAGLLTLLPGKSTIKGSFEINPGINTGTKVTGIELKYKKKFAWIAKISRTVFSYKKYMHGGLTYDAFPSSRFQYNLNDNNGKGGKKIPIIGGFDYNFHVVSSIPFVPTTSALCVGGGKKTLTASSYTTLPNTSDTPFGGNYYIQKNNSVSHMDFRSDALQWMLAQILFGINGPTLGATGTKYYVSIKGLLITAQWKTDNPNIATISQKGTLKVVGKGIVNITATANLNDLPGLNLSGTIVLNKRIAVGTPRFVLDEVKRIPGYFCIKAKCIDNQEGYSDFISENKNIVTYQWGIKTDNSTIKWLNLDSPEVRLSTLEDKENTTVYLKTIDWQGNESTPIFVRITGYDIYDLPIKTLIINNKGDFYTDNGTKLNYQSMNFPIIFRKTSQGKFNNAKWNPVAAVITNDENAQRGIIWNRNGYIRDIIPVDEIERIKTFDDNRVALYRLKLLNFDGDIIQNTPFNIVYKANFPK